MKGISKVIIFLFLICLVSINVLAQNEDITDAAIEQETQDIVQNEITNNPDLTNLGVTPGQSGYGLKITLEKFRLALTFNREKKAELALHLADLRIREATLMAARDRLEELERTNTEYKKYIVLAEGILDTLGTSENALKAQARIKVRLNEQQEQVDEFEALILIKAKGLTEEQKQKLLALIEEFNAQNDNFELKLVNKEDSLRVRLRARGLTAQQIETEYEQEKNKTMNLTKEEILQRRAQHKIDQAPPIFLKI